MQLLRLDASQCTVELSQESSEASRMQILICANVLMACFGGIIGAYACLSQKLGHRSDGPRHNVARGFFFFWGLRTKKLNAVLQATSLQTPSPTANPRFVVTSDDSFGTPDVVGVANLLSQYREDRRLRVHETPFEERCPSFPCP